MGHGSSGGRPGSRSFGAFILTSGYVTTPHFAERETQPEAGPAGQQQDEHGGRHGQRPPRGGAALTGAQVFVFEAFPELAVRGRGVGGEAF